MLRLIHALLALTLVCLTACGGGSENEMQSVMTDITTVLKDVKTAEDADAVKAKLEPLMAKMGELTKAAAEDPSKFAAASDAESAKAFADVSTAYSTELTRVLSDPALNEKLGEALTKMNQ